MAVIRFKLNGGATTPARALKPGVNRLGRGEDNDIKIDHISVSWHHCQLELGEEELVVRDTQSRNGTFINERQILEASALREGQTLRMGDVEALVEQLPVRAPAPRSAKSPVHRGCRRNAERAHSGIDPWPAAPRSRG